MSETDIHGTNHAEHQRVYKLDRSVDPKIVTFHFAAPVTEAQLESLMQYLRTWHP